ncbi:Protein JTB [Trichoplax sp. H2]|uniref:Protein JTB n=1 Tax=Trichoplax adhaerens TaxID=10228 RepID=B3RT23_TRIAD|nr:hypothetical protein TRIADDRAFT_54810 [Trichoplax adhaerens]EDV27152.1 hypothetical protein TRIADDRAFT_54810 [Trichoplax adhaerens]RDD45728.1 Protein JTB [Trichoplax sp. H2]|eukprot:XP_002111148.1 hypothetical protein TRIADDRAFT_54810 [Trichoplax adhaerens]
MAQPHLIKLIIIVILLIVIQICLESLYASRKNEGTVMKSTASNTTTNQCGEIIEVGECLPCSAFDKKSRAIRACAENGNKQLVKCRKSRQKFYKSCLMVPWIAERNYWIFQVFMLIVALPSWATVWIRRRKLEEQARRRVQRQINDIL